MKTMEVAEPRSSVNEVFGYRKIKWKICNYFAGKHYFANSYASEWIQSPIFCVYSPFLTKWELGISPNPGCYDKVCIYLKRVDNDRRFVSVNWKCLFPCAEDDDKEFEESAIFKTSDSLSILEREFNDFEQSVLETSFHFTVECPIMVFGNDDSKALEYYGSRCLKSLSQDLVVLRRYKKETDTKLYYGAEKTVDVHRAVLSCRNNVFKNMINGRSIADLTFPSEYLKGLEKLILFLYSGNLKYVLKAPSFEIEKAIEYFNVEELKEYFAYDELSIETTLFVREIQFKWTVCNLDRIKRGCILSHRFKGLKDEIFRLVLYPRGLTGIEDYMSAKIQLLEGEQPKNLCVYFGVYDIYNEIRDVKCWRWPTYEVGSIILNKIISVDRNILNVFYDIRGKIKFFCKFQELTGQFIRPFEERCPVINKINSSRHYEKLSEDMTYLYTNCASGDLLVFTRDPNIVHRVHKMVLCSRSDKLFKAIAGKRWKIYMKNVEPEVIDITFHYMYTGVLKKTESETILIKVLRFGDSLGVQGLRNACARILEANLNARSAIGVLIAAHDLKEWGLRLAALKFIRSNYIEVSTQEYWEILIYLYPALYRDVIEFVSFTGNDQIDFEDFEIDEIL